MLPVQFMTEVLQAIPTQCASWLPPIGDNATSSIVSLIQGTIINDENEKLKEKKWV